MITTPVVVADRRSESITSRGKDAGNDRSPIMTMTTASRRARLADVGRRPVEGSRYTVPSVRGHPLRGATGARSPGARAAVAHGRPTNVGACQPLSDENIHHRGRLP